jgi:hypothetical protein
VAASDRLHIAYGTTQMLGAKLGIAHETLPGERWPGPNSGPFEKDDTESVLE